MRLRDRAYTAPGKRTDFGRTRGRRLRLMTLGSLLAAALVLTGCWDRLEIEDRATVVAIGIDPETGGHGLHITAQIAIPGQIPLGPGGGGAGGGGAATPRETVFVQGADGPTLSGALTSLQQTLNDQLFLGHVRVIIVNETLARQGLADLSDFPLRDPEIRRTTWLLVSADNAADVVNAAPAFSRVPALYFSDMMEHSVNMGLLPPTFFGTYLVQSAAQGSDAVVPYIWARGQGTRLLGAAVFRGQRMVDAIDLSDLQTLENVIGPKKSAQILTVPLSGTPGAQVRLRVVGRQTQISASLKGGQPSVDVRIRLEGNIVEEVGANTLQSPEELKAISASAGQIVRQDVLRLVARTQADRADIFGFGEQFRGKTPGFFRKQVGSKEAWENTYYPHLKVEVHVKVLVRRLGTKAQ